jgi:hypothetical protein
LFLFGLQFILAIDSCCSINGANSSYQPDELKETDYNYNDNVGRFVDVRNKWHVYRKKKEGSNK